MPSYRVASALYLRFLGVAYLVAFLSFWVQLEGLVGARGILPARETMAIVEQQIGGGLAAYVRFPTLCLLGTSDAFLHATLAAGVIAALSIIAGVLPLAALALALILYLSVVTIGRDFMAFQWDNLLLEAGLLALLVAPARVVAPLRALPAPPRAALVLHHWLLFRLIFSSGFAKLHSGDRTWRDLTALNYHYETQPLPTWVGYYAHQLPEWFQQLSVIGTFVIQLGAPFLIFGPRRLRRAAALAIGGHQLLIALTGNYGFFNLLALALVLWLLDDDLIARGARLRARLLDEPARRPSRAPVRVLVAAVVLVLVVTSGLVFSRTLGVEREEASWSHDWLEAIHPFRVVNPYGLFAVMTTERPEIVIEGTEDGTTWREYTFRYKPGPLDRAPGFLAPHMPRLDWQLWFAALGSPRANRWFPAFMHGLSVNEPSIVGLLESNPFELAPPRSLRALLYRYRFTSLAERGATGHEWRREALRLYWSAPEDGPH